MAFLARLATAIGKPCQPVLAVQRDHIGRRDDLDIRMFLQPFDQIFRHCFAQRPATEDDVDLLRHAREIDGALSRRIARPDDRDFGIAAELRLHRCRAIIDSAPFIGFDALDRQALILRAARDDRGARAQFASVGQSQAIGIAVALDRGGPHRRHEPCAEFLCLHRRPPRQLVARNAGREAQVIFDLRRSSCLPARRQRIDRDHVEAFRRRINRRGEAARPAADNNDVGGRTVGEQIEPEPCGELLGRRLDQHVGRAQYHDRQLRRVDPALGKQMRGNRPLVGVEPAVRHPMLLQQVAQRIDAAIHRRPDHDRHRKATCLAEFAPRRQHANEDIRIMRIPRDQPLEIRIGNPQYVAVGAHLDAREVALPGQH